MAEQYIELISSTQVHADDLALIARHLSIRPGAVLDVGCGPGHLTADLRSLEVDATGLDVRPADRSAAQRRIPFFPVSDPISPRPDDQEKAHERCADHSGDDRRLGVAHARNPL
jgi:cyclopropane fatty-acyl-phospholipid synthase-like methyltransferase